MALSEAGSALFSLESHRLYGSVNFLGKFSLDLGVCLFAVYIPGHSTEFDYRKNQHNRYPLQAQVMLAYCWQVSHGGKMVATSTSTSCIGMPKLSCAVNFCWEHGRDLPSNEDL